MEFECAFFNYHLNGRNKIWTMKYKLNKFCFIFYYHLKYKHISVLEFEEPLWTKFFYIKCRCYIWAYNHVEWASTNKHIFQFWITIIPLNIDWWGSKNVCTDFPKKLKMHFKILDAIRVAWSKCNHWTHKY